MAFFHRKILQKAINKVVIHLADGPCPTKDEDCRTTQVTLQRPPLIPTPSSKHSSIPTSLIFLFCGLAVSFCFMCYIILVTIYRRRQRNRENIERIHEDFINGDLGPAMHPHPIWLINTIGLDESQIESIQVIKYQKGQGLIEGTDCSVCLSEFEEDESLRLLPKCSHAFHVPCIDTWLRSHKNCPLCRAPIIKNTSSDQTDQHGAVESNLIDSSTNEGQNPSQDSETIDQQHVVEIENNGQVEKTWSTTRVRVQSDLADRYRVQNEEFVAIRRSVSVGASLVSVKPPLDHDQERRSGRSPLVVSKKLDSKPKRGHKQLKGSSSSINIRSKVMKSSSFGHSLRKASSFTAKSYYNRSY